MAIRLLRLAPALLLSAAAAAQDIQVPHAEAVRIAAFAAGDPANLAGTGIPTDPDLKYAVGLRDGERGVLALPETRLGPEALDAEGTVPAAQLWLRGVHLLRDGLPLPAGCGRVVTFAAPGAPAIEVVRYSLALRPAAGGGRELAVFGDGPEALFAVPADAIAGIGVRPVELSAERGDDATGSLIVRLAGRREARLDIALAVRPAAMR